MGANSPLPFAFHIFFCLFSETCNLFGDYTLKSLGDFTLSLDSIEIVIYVIFNNHNVTLFRIKLIG